MTYVQYVEWLLDRDWRDTRPGRAVAVPMPKLVTESGTTKEMLRTQDVVEIKDGGPQSREPASFHWVEESRESLVEVDIRTADRRVDGTATDGRVRLNGYRNTGDTTDQYGFDPGEAEDNGGLVGEIGTIISGVRRGDKEFDLINGFEVNDISGTTGKNHYRAQMTIRFREIARTI